MGEAVARQPGDIERIASPHRRHAAGTNCARHSSGASTSRSSRLFLVRPVPRNEVAIARRRVAIPTRTGHRPDRPDEPERHRQRRHERPDLRRGMVARVRHGVDHGRREALANLRRSADVRHVPARAAWHPERLATRNTGNAKKLQAGGGELTDHSSVPAPQGLRARLALERLATMLNTNRSMLSIDHLRAATERKLREPQPVSGA